MQVANPLTHLISQAGGLQFRSTGLHEYFVLANLHGNQADRPMYKRVSQDFSRRCIGAPRMYQPGFAI